MVNAYRSPKHGATPQESPPAAPPPRFVRLATVITYLGAASLFFIMWVELRSIADQSILLGIAKLLHTTRGGATVALTRLFHASYIVGLPAAVWCLWKGRPVDRMIVLLPAIILFWVLTRVLNRYW